MTDPQRVDVERLSELLDKATPGPWFVGNDNEGEPRPLWTVENQAYSTGGDDDAPLQLAVLYGGKEDAELVSAMHEALPALLHAREGAEQDRWRTDWPEMTPVSKAHPSIWQSERVIVSLVGGRVTHDVAESFDGQRPLWFIHRDKVRAWQPFPAAFLAANGGRDE